MNYKKKINTIFISIYFNFIFFSPAHAYLDPGSINVFLQTILAAIAGIGATYQLWIDKIKNLFNKKKINLEKNKDTDKKKNL